MPLHLITGRANAGKSGEVNTRLFAALARGETPTLVLPSVADTRRAVAELSEKAPTGVAVVAFRRWANGLWRLHGDGRRIVGEASRDAFVRRAITEVHPTALDEVLASPGFSVMIGRTVAAMIARPDEGATATGSLEGVERICARYCDLLAAGGLIEAAEAWHLLGTDPPALGGAIVVNRFAEFDTPTEMLLSGLSTTNEVTVALTWEKDFAPTRALDLTAERLGALAETVVHVREPEPTGELQDLLGVLYSGSGSLETSGAVRMGLAAGSEAEAALVASFVAETISQGTEAERVVVAFPRLDAVAHRLGTALSAEGIDFDVDIARPVVATSFGRSLDGLLTLAQGAGDRTTALAVLLGPNSDIALDTVAELDRAWRRFRIGDPNRLLSDIIKHDQSLLGQAARLARSLARTPVGPESGNNWQVLMDLLLSAAAMRFTATGARTARELAAALETDANSARAMVRAIGEMASVEGTPFRLGDVRSALRTIVAGGTAGERQGRVQITELSRLRSRRFDTVIIGGLTAGEMPASNSDSLADELQARFASEPLAQGEDRARFGFYQAISRARHTLLLVRRETDDSGTPVRASALWDEVADAYRRPGEDIDAGPRFGPAHTHLGAARIAESAPVFTKGRRELRLAAAGGECLLGAVVRGELTDGSVLAELSRIEAFSATEIEAYLQCPYRWFYERVVRPEDIDSEVDARVIGSIAHSLLKAFYDALPAALDATRVTPGNAAAAAELLGTVVAQTDTGIVAEGLAEELDLARAARWVAAAVADDAYVLPEFAPSSHEFAFGGPGETPIRLGGVHFRGRIDRIDVSPTAVFITDYKASRQVSGYAKFAEDGKIQAVVYALVAAEKTGLPVAGSVYRSLRSRQMRGFWRADLLHGALAFGRDDDSIGAERFDEIVADTAGRIEVAVAGIRAGRVPREPAKKACLFCALQTQCEGARR